MLLSLYQNKREIGYADGSGYGYGGERQIATVFMRGAPIPIPIPVTVTDFPLLSVYRPCP